MAKFTSFLAPLIRDYVTYQKASGRWNDTSYEPNLLLFDRYYEATIPKRPASPKTRSTRGVANGKAKPTIPADPASMWWLVSSGT